MTHNELFRRGFVVLQRVIWNEWFLLAKDALKGVRMITRFLNECVFY
jgi:hypothetical protein